MTIFKIVYTIKANIFLVEIFRRYNMITTLHIKNIGIIDDLSIDLNNGLNVLTGETGAGKTLIIDSLQIISGGRFSKDMIRKSLEGIPIKNSDEKLRELILAFYNSIDNEDNPT